MIKNKNLLLSDHILPIHIQKQLLEGNIFKNDTSSQFLLSLSHDQLNNISSLSHINQYSLYNKSQELIINPLYHMIEKLGFIQNNDINTNSYNLIQFLTDSETYLEDTNKKNKLSSHTGINKN